MGIRRVGVSRGRGRRGPINRALGVLRLMQQRLVRARRLSLANLVGRAHPRSLVCLRARRELWNSHHRPPYRHPRGRGWLGEELWQSWTESTVVLVVRGG